MYCSQRPSETGDHIFAREFFIVSRRDNLPQVPACSSCNGEKGVLEHYLTAVLPFGGCHTDAKVNLKSMVPPRLEKNESLHRRLKTGWTKFWTQKRSGLYLPTATVPFDGEKLEDLFVFIAKGLVWHHWGVLLEPNCQVDVNSLTKRGESFFEDLLNKRAKERVIQNVGEGTFEYHGAQAIDDPQISVWLFSLYGGLKTTGKSGPSMEAASKIGVLIGPKNVFENAEKRRKMAVRRI